MRGLLTAAPLRLPDDLPPELAEIMCSLQAELATCPPETIENVKALLDFENVEEMLRLVETKSRSIGWRDPHAEVLADVLLPHPAGDVVAELSRPGLQNALADSIVAAGLARDKGARQRMRKRARRRARREADEFSTQRK